MTVWFLERNRRQLPGVQGLVISKGDRTRTYDVHWWRNWQGLEVTNAKPADGVRVSVDDAEISVSTNRDYVAEGDLEELIGFEYGNDVKTHEFVAVDVGWNLVLSDGAGKSRVYVVSLWPAREFGIWATGDEANMGDGYFAIWQTIADEMTNRMYIRASLFYRGSDS